MPRVRIARSVAVLLGVGLVAACSAQPDPTPSPDPVPPATTTATPSTGNPAALVMAPCVIRGEVPVKAEVAGLCGTLDVPEDRSNPSGRRVGLRVAVIPAVAAVPRPDPLFAIAGGPKEASSEFFAWMPGVYADVHATRDIVLVDQRGTGASNAVSLPAMPDVSGLSAAEADAALATWIRDTLAATDVDPRFYTSAVAADDLDEVRQALGYDRVNLYGASYGGTLAQYYLRRHGDHVRVAVLDGATPLDVPVFERIAASSQQALDLLLSRCEQDTACRGAFPDLRAEWTTLRAGLETGITTTVVNPETGEAAVAELALVGPSLHNALLTGSGAARIPLAIHLASEGRWDQTGQLVPPVSSGGPTLLMADEIFCSEAWARFEPGEVERVGNGSYALPAQLAEAATRERLCRHLPKGVVAPGDGAPLRTSLPILWLTADADPQDPPANLTAVPAQQPNARIIVVPGHEHVVGHLGCGPKVVAAFLDAGTTAGLDASCMAAPAAMAWQLELPQP